MSLTPAALGILPALGILLALTGCSGFEPGIASDTIHNADCNGIARIRRRRRRGVSWIEPSGAPERANDRRVARGRDRDVAPVTEVRSTLLASSILALRERGHFEPMGMEILGNTVVQAPGARHALQFLSTAGGGNVVRDNILYHPDSAKAGIELGAAADVPNVDTDYNVIDRFVLDDSGNILALSDLQATYSKEQHSIAGATPSQLFTNAATNDYSLASGSPAVGKGIYVADAPTDQAGKARPTSAPNIGALEH